MSRSSTSTCTRDQSNRDRVTPSGIFLRNAPSLFAIIGVLLSLRLLIVYRLLGVEISIGDAFGSGFMECLVWLPFVFPGLWIASCVHASRWRPTYVFVFHTAIGSLFSLGHLTLFSTLSGALRSARFGDAFVVNLQSALFSMFVPGVIFYGLLVVSVWWVTARDKPSKPEQSQTAPKSPALLAFRVGRGQLHMRSTEIDWIRAAGNYLELHGNGTTHLVRETLNSLLTRLEPGEFRRIHRSTVVRRNAIQALHDGSNSAIILHDGTRLSVGKTYRDELRNTVP